MTKQCPRSYFEVLGVGLSEVAEQRQAHAPGQGLVVVGASAGGVEVLKEVVTDLPGDLLAAVCVTSHIAPSSPSALANILERAGLIQPRPVQ